MQNDISTEEAMEIARKRTNVRYNGRRGCITGIHSDTFNNDSPAIYFVGFLGGYVESHIAEELEAVEEDPHLTPTITVCLGMGTDTAACPRCKRKISVCGEAVGKYIFCGECGGMLKVEGE